MPKFTDLKERFKGVADWDSVCPYLLDDADGQVTREIEKNHNNIDDRRTEMLEEFLKGPNPTWRDVVNALKKGGYINLANKIRKELQRC